eukprot:412757_1
MAAQKKLLVEIEGTDNDGQYGTKSFKLPSRDDWSTNLQTINKKISKKFQVEEEYGLEINGQSVRYDDPDGLVAIMKDVDIDQGELVFKIIDISQVNSGANQGRKIVVHYNDEEFVHYADQELSKLDDDFYDEMYDAIKSAFKIRGKMGKIYEDVSGKKLYCDDWDDLSELLEDKEDGEALDLYIEGKGGKKSMPKSKGPGFNKPTNVPSKRKKTKTPQKTTDEEKEDYSNNALYIWCKSNGLQKYFKKFLDDFEIMDPQELIELNVSQLADDLGLKYGSKSRFIKAVDVLRSNQQSAGPAAAYSEGIQSPQHSLGKTTDVKQDAVEPKNEELFAWCKKIGISKFYDSLKNHIESPSDFTELTSTDIDDLCKLIGIKFGFKSKFKKAIKEIQKIEKADDRQKDDAGKKDELFVWCKQAQIGKFYEALKQHISSPLDFTEFTATDIDDLCKLIGIKFGFKSKFKKAIKEIQKIEKADDRQKDDAGKKDELFVWCKQAQIGKFYEALKQHISSPLDFTEFTATDIDDLCKSIGIKFGFKSKFKKAIKEIQSQHDEKEEKKTKEPEEAKMMEPLKPKRNLQGVVLVPCTKMEYQAPRKQYAHSSQKKQTGLMAGAASIIKTVTNTFFSWDTKQPQQLNKRKEKRKVMKAPKHRIIGTGNNKVIMIVGQTGAGKTTLINSMMNYIYGVEYDDAYRFRLIQEKPKQTGQAESQTDHVSTYHIRREDGWRIPYDLTIIDTPGFADTRGIEKDKQIVADIRYFFENILDGIDGVCFVVKSTDNRLTGAQNYVFNNVLNLWAKDILDNIFVLLTFCDGKRPPVMDALGHHQVLKNCKIFRLNNSAYSEDPANRNPNEDDSFDQMFWNMGSKCFANFFKSLNATQTKSINESREVLKQREAIQVKIEDISISVDNALSKQQNIASQTRAVKDNLEAINANKQVFHPDTTSEWVKVPSSNKVITTCFHCKHKTCHPGCCVSDKFSCGVMNGDNVCTICGCHVQEHRNTDYYYKYKTTTIQVSNWDTHVSQKDRHQAAKLGLSKAETILKSLAKEKKRLEQDVTKMIADILGYRNYLEKVALRPTLTTVGDYIDQLIQNEEDCEHRDNDKIKQLKKYKQQE